MPEPDTRTSKKGAPQPRPPPDQIKQYLNHTTAAQPERSRKRREADLLPQYLLELSKQIPFIGPGIATVEDLIREKKRAQFEERTKEQLYEISRSTVEQSRRVSGLEFQSHLADDRLKNLEKVMAYLMDTWEKTSTALDLNSQLDAVRADSMAIHVDYLNTIRKLEDWLALLHKGDTPPELFTGKVLESVKDMIQTMGWDINVKFQDARSTVVPTVEFTNTLTILSNIRVTAPPWDLYMLQTLPTWNHQELFREHLNTKYIAIDSYFGKYVSMDQETFGQCLDQACELRGPIRALGDAECGIKALLGTSNSDSCQVRKITSTEDFFEPSPAGVIYAVQERQTITMTCPHSGEPPQRVVIEGSGLLMIPDGCQAINSKGVTFKGPPYWGIPSPTLRKAENIASSIHDMNRWLGRINYLVDEAVHTHDVLKQGPYYAFIGMVTLVSGLAAVLIGCIGWRIWKCARPTQVPNRPIFRPRSDDVSPEPRPQSNQEIAETLRWYRRVINNVCSRNRNPGPPGHSGGNLGRSTPQYPAREMSSLATLAERERRLRSQPLIDTPDRPATQRDSVTATRGSQTMEGSPSLNSTLLGVTPNTTRSTDNTSLEQGRKWNL